MNRLIPVIVAVAALGAACGTDDTAEAAPAVIIDGASAAPLTDDTPTGDTATDDPETTGEPEAPTEVPESATGATSFASEEEQALAFAECMREQGLAFPDPVVSADGSIQLIDPNNPPDIEPGSPEVDAATEVCGPIIEGASFLPGAGDTTEIEDQLLDFAQCLRDQGIEVNDPDLSGGMNPAIIQQMFGDWDPQAPENAAVVSVCQAALAGLGGN